MGEDIGGGASLLGRRSCRGAGGGGAGDLPASERFGDGAAMEKASGFSAGSLGLIILPPVPLPLRAFSK